MSEAGSKDRREKNYLIEEKAVIIDAMRKYNKFLHGKESGSTSKVRKDQILAQIAAEVSALGYANRTPDKIAKKINDLRRLVKEKVAKIKKHSRGTGGGPALKLRLTPDEEVIARCLEKEQVEGLEGFESVDQPLRTDVQDEAGPSSATGQPTPSQDTSVHTSPLEEVEEEHGHLDDGIYLGDETTVAGPSHTSIGDTPPRDSNFIVTPPRASTLLGSPLRASDLLGSPSSLREVPSGSSPYIRPQASPAPRKAIRKTRGDPDALEATLAMDLARQTHHVGSVACDMRRVAASLASMQQTQAAFTATISENVQEVSANSTALVTCVRDLDDTNSGLVAEVRSLGVAIQANTAAIEAVGNQTTAVLTRIALALEGIQAARERPGDVPPPNDPPPPPAAAPRQQRARSLGTRRSPRRAR